MTLDDGNRRKRQLILSGNPWLSIVSVCGPMAVFQLINQLFRVFDLSITAHIDTQAVAAVSFFSQLSNTFGAIGGGFAMGAGILIAGFYGAGDYQKVKQTVNSSFCISVLMAALLTMILIGFSTPILKLANAPAALAQTGLDYYRWEMLGLVFTYFNNVYIAVEKARGNGKIILWLNLMLAVVKISLSALFVLVLHQGIVMISVATLLANMVIFFVGLYRMRNPQDVFGLSFSYVDLRLRTIRSVFGVSLPVMAEKVAFSAGKVMVNAIGVAYGTQVIGALGVSNAISAISTMPPSSIGDGGAAMIRQNVGGGNKKRAFLFFRCIFILNFILGIVGFALTLLFLNALIRGFSGGDAAFGLQIKEVFTLEMCSNVFLAINSSVMALLYGFGYTRLSFALNFARLFVFRLPLLIFAQQVLSIPGSTAMGMVMMVSNGLTGIASLGVAAVILAKEYGKNWTALVLQPSKQLED